jgi:DNA-binding CsgD family transcriptional regulator
MSDAAKGGIGAARAFIPIDVELVRGLVARLGHDGFLDAFALACEALSGAEQVTAFFAEAGRVRCVLAHRPSAPELVEDLCAHYERIYYSRDELLAHHARGGEDYAAVPVASVEIADGAYRDRLFAAARLGGKIALIASANGRIVYVNLYFAQPEASAAALPTLDAHGPLLTQLLMKHDALTGGYVRPGAARQKVDAFLRQRFPALSQREAQIAALIACGLSVEAIAAEAGVASASIVTFRRRGYAKMGIASRAELFALCAGLAL